MKNKAYNLMCEEYQINPINAELYKKSVKQCKEIVRVVIDDLVFGGFSSKLPMKKLKKQVLKSMLKSENIESATVYQMSVFIIGYLYGKKFITLELFNEAIKSYEEVRNG